VIHNIDELPRFMLVVHQDALVSTLGPCSLSLRSIVHGPLNATADPRGIVPSPESMVIKNVMFSLGSFSSITCTTARFGAVCSSSWIPAMPQCSMSKIRLETLNKGLQCKANASHVHQVSTSLVGRSPHSVAQTHPRRPPKTRPMLVHRHILLVGQCLSLVQLQCGTMISQSCSNLPSD
jgi:hypothetical protein